jgi:hypothetical protein
MHHLATKWLAILVCLPGLAVAQTLATDPDTLARQVLAALKAKDQQALETLTINAAEFKKYIWPTITTRVNSSGQMNAEKFYAIYRKSSDASLAQHLAEYGGKPYALVKVNTGEQKQYKGYRLLPNPEITVRGESGEEKTLRLGSALLEHDGGYKLASFYRTPEGAKR